MHIRASQCGEILFFNSLLGEDRSIVSEIAGTTRDVVRERINLRGEAGQVAFRLSDTAGLRVSSDLVEGLGIERSIQAARESDLVVVVIDGLNSNLEELKTQFEMVPCEGKQVVLVVSKADLLSQDARESAHAAVRASFGIDPLFVSSRSLEGVKEVAAKMADLASTLLRRGRGEVVLTQVEHVRAVESSLQILERASGAFDLVLFASDVRHAMNALGPLTGETLPDDVLGKIFSDFCIGK